VKEKQSREGEMERCGKESEGLGGIGRDREGLGGIGKIGGLGGIERDWERLGGIGKDWEGLGGIERDWEGSGGIGRDWEGMEWEGSRRGREKEEFLTHCPGTSQRTKQDNNSWYNSRRRNFERSSL
jgi:hypothetical protein